MPSAGSVRTVPKIALQFLLNTLQFRTKLQYNCLIRPTNAVLSASCLNTVLNTHQLKILKNTNLKNINYSYLIWFEKLACFDYEHVNTVQFGPFSSFTYITINVSPPQAETARKPPKVWVSLLNFWMKFISRNTVTWVKKKTSFKSLWMTPIFLKHFVLLPSQPHQFFLKVLFRRSIIAECEEVSLLPDQF